MNFKTLHSSWSIIFPLALLALVCSAQTACSSQPSASRSLSLFPPIPEKEELREVVIINGETYRIPPPWRGNRFTAPKFDYTDFRRVPLEYTHNNTKIYILAAAHQPLVTLLQAAEKDGILLKVESAYRSEGYQKRIFKRMLAKGRTFDDIIRYVAPPGYSQHMLGTAVDFFPSNWRFADTTAYIWLQENGRRFGFVETYPRSNQMKIPWESWHWNYIGDNDGHQDGSEFSPVGPTKEPGGDFDEIK